MTKISNQYSLTNILTADLANSRLGINNVSPTVALDVTGAGRFSSSVTALSLDVISSSGAGTSTATGLARFITAATTIAISVGQFNAARKLDLYSYGISVTGEEFNLGTSTAHPLVFQTNATERMRITSDGNVGIGMTPYNNGLSKAIDLVGGGGMFGFNNGFYLSGNGYFTDAWRYKATGGLSIIELSSAGNIVFSNVGSGSANASASPTEKMRITSGGSLLMAKDAVIGINTVDGSDNGYLALCGAGADGENRGGHIYLSGNERSADPGTVVLSAGNVIGVGSVIAFRTAGVERMRLIGNGRLLIGTSTDQGYMLFVNGNAAGTSGFANVSDRRLKKDIIPIESALNKVKLLNGVSFNWDKTLRPDLNVDDNNHLGLIAQDVETILPQVVTTGDDEFNTKTIIYSDIVPVLIEAIKELSAKVSLLENK